MKHWARSGIVLSLALQSGCFFVQEKKAVNLSAKDSDSPDLKSLGERVYNSRCVSCHHPLGSTNIRGVTIDTIRTALDTQSQMGFLRGTLSVNELAGLEKYLEIPSAEFESCGNVVAKTGDGILTNEEYRNVIKDLLQLQQADIDAVRLPSQTVGGGLGFDNEAIFQRMAGNLEEYFVASFDVATAAVAQGWNETKCMDGEVPLTCAKRVLNGLAYKAFRRPLSNAQKTVLTAFFNAGTDFRDGMMLGIRSILVSPYFLFKTQLGSGPLDAFDLASRLSFFLWRTIPDAELLGKAADGSLLADSVLRTQVQRLLASNRAVAYENSFAAQWLEIGSFTGSSDALEASAFTETQLFFRNLRSGNGLLTDVYGANYSYLNNTLATNYGIGGTFTSQHVRTNFASADHRQGILTHASILMASSGQSRTSPVSRGLYVRNKFMCLSIGEPPGDVPPLDETDLESMSIREALARHEAKSTTCAGCHSRLDPYGWPLEFYGTRAQFRTRYPSGFAVDGHSNPLELQSVALNDGIDLANALNNAVYPQACVVEKHARFATGRALTENEKCHIRNIARRNFTATGKLSDLIKDFVTSPVFKGRN